MAYYLSIRCINWFLLQPDLCLIEQLISSPCSKLVAVSIETPKMLTAIAKKNTSISDIPRQPHMYFEQNDKTGVQPSSSLILTPRMVIIY